MPVKTTSRTRRQNVGRSLPGATDAESDDSTTHRLRQEQRSLRALMEAMGSDLPLRELLQRILRSACELLNANHGTIGLVDESRGLVRTEAAHNMPPNELGAEMRPGEGIAGQVLATRRPVVLRRYGELANPTQPSMLEHAVLGMPILWHGGMIGFLGIGRSGAAGAASAGAPPFSDEEKATLATFAHHAAIAIRITRVQELERERARRLAIINRVGRIITADLRLEELLQTAADALHELLGYPNIAIPLVEHGDPDILVVSAVGGAYKRVVQHEVRIPVTQGIMGAAVRSQRSVMVNDVANDARYIPVPGSVGIVAELAVPILLGDEVLGVLNVESEYRLSTDDVEHLRIVADQLAVAIDNARLHAATRDLVLVEERQRLARELHDSVTQLIFSITLVAQSLAPAWRRDPTEGERRTARVLELSQHALGEMRSMLSELRSAEDATVRMRMTDEHRTSGSTQRRDLVDAIRMHVASFAGEPLRISVRAPASVDVPQRVQDALFRITQEALFNVMKHASASQASVRLSCSEAECRLQVSDDGVGIDASNVRRAEGRYGLVFMRERAEALGGTLIVRRRATKGTMVDARVPLLPSERAIP